MRLKPFYYLPPPYNCSVPLEKYCSFGNYTVKGYDYGRWHNLVKDENLFKLEIVFKKMQKIYELTGRTKVNNPITFEDLKDRGFLTLLNDFYSKTLHTIDKQPIIDYSAIKPRKREFMFAGQQPEYWETEKQINSNTAKKKRADYLNLYREISINGNIPYKEIEQKFKTEFLQLINN